MTDSELFRAMMISRYDQMKASVRDFIERNGDDEICLYAGRLLQGIDSADPDEALKSHLAMLGLLDAWCDLVDR
jgi:hypothetical protein